jgi:hypothetical protein
MNNSNAKRAFEILDELKPYINDDNKDLIQRFLKSIVNEAIHMVVAPNLNGLNSLDSKIQNLINEFDDVLQDVELSGNQYQKFYHDIMDKINGLIPGTFEFEGGRRRHRRSKRTMKKSHRRHRRTTRSHRSKRR